MEHTADERSPGCQNRDLSEKASSIPQDDGFLGHSYAPIHASGNARILQGDQHLHYYGKPAEQEGLEKLSRELYFEKMDDRYIQIEDAHNETLKWIFEPPDREKPPCDSFVDWLKNNEPVYWVAGKPGSGKSTLMKYLVKRLEDDRESKRLVLSFWFWEAGEDIQHNLTGCLRSLLWQLLLEPKSRDLVFSKIRTIPGRVWDRNRLQNALTLVLTALMGNRIPVCISSRQEQLFEDVFATCPTLRLQDLNAGDIDEYVEKELLLNSKLHIILDRDERHFFKDEIRSKAQGVFLWVRLVVKSLLLGVTKRDDQAQLRRRLETFPSDLHKLYEYMLRRQGDDVEHYREEASLYLKLTLHREMGIIEFCLVINHRLRQRYLDQDTWWDMKTVQKDLDCRRVMECISPRTAGLLEVPRHRPLICDDPPAYDPRYEPLTEFLREYQLYTVRFIHRTARTYILETARGNNLLTSCSEDADDLARILFESKLAYSGVLCNLIFFYVDPDMMRRCCVSSYDGRDCLPAGWTEDFERVFNGFLKMGRCSLDQFWIPGADARECLAVLSIDNQTIDFCRFYAAHGIWQAAQAKLDQFLGDQLSIDDLPMLLVYAARGTLYMPAENGFSKLFRGLLNKGADPNRVLTTDRGEKIWLAPYIASYITSDTSKEVLASLLTTDPCPGLEGLPAMSSCSRCFWVFNPVSDSIITQLWGSGVAGTHNLVRSQWHANRTPLKVSALTRRIYVIAGEACRQPNESPVLYPVTAEDSETLSTLIEEDVFEFYASKQPVSPRIYAIMVGILACSHETENAFKFTVPYIDEIQRRTTPFSSFLEALTFTGKSHDTILKWAAAEETILRRHKREEDVQRWKTWVFGKNTSQQVSKSLHLTHITDKNIERTTLPPIRPVSTTQDPREDHVKSHTGKRRASTASLEEQTKRHRT
ncbi:hypothetical protein OHC33_003330 [Knufia fluminis]|uniref:Nephrocystin 3-like N-terminal domain-containing protein n=1 Tax=Knufia fluminis TaxID=191047 RepID=A0AAN8EHC6_9EURO|nr:hypothetical protein OHC33_003330 [Knufia fluminis]